MYKDVHPILGTRDIQRAMQFYTRQLGFTLAFDDKQRSNEVSGAEDRFLDHPTQTGGTTKATWSLSEFELEGFRHGRAPTDDQIQRFRDSILWLPVPRNPRR